MRTTISISDEIFNGAERLARIMDVSRSKLYVSAIKSYLKAHKDGAISAKLNEVYDKIDSKPDPGVVKLQAGSVSRDPW